MDERTRRIHRALADAGLTRPQRSRWAARADTSVSTVDNVLKGVASPESTARVLAAIGLTPADLEGRAA